MIVAANPVTIFLPEFGSSNVLPAFGTPGHDFTAAASIIFNGLSKIRTLLSVFNHAPFIFSNLQTLYARYIRGGTFEQLKALLTYSRISLYRHPRPVQLSRMFSAKYELFAPFCNVDPLFSSLYELFAQKHPG